MNQIDEELRRALRREEPPAGFAERLLERLPAAPPVVVPMPARDRAKPRFALAVAAALAIATGSVAFVAIPRSNIETEVAGVQPAPPPMPMPSVVPETGEPSVVGPDFETEIGDPGPAKQPRRVRHVAPRRGDDEAASRAAEQLRLALHITGDKLNVARREARESLAVPQS